MIFLKFRKNIEVFNELMIFLLMLCERFLSIFLFYCCLLKQFYMDEFINRIREIIRLQQEGNTEAVELYNDLITNTPNSINFIIQFLFQSPQDPLCCIIFPSLSRYIWKFSEADQISLILPLFNLYFMLNRPDISYLKLISSISLANNIFENELISILFSKLTSNDENMIKLASYSIKYILRIAAAQLETENIIILINQIYQHFLNHINQVFANQTSCILVTNILKTLTHHYNKIIYLITEADLLNHLYFVIQYPIDSQIQISDSIYIDLYSHLFKFIDSVLTIEDPLYSDFFYPFLYNVVSNSLILFNMLSSKNPAKWFLKILILINSRFDFTEFIPNLVQICLLSIKINEDDLEYIENNPTLYYSIAFECCFAERSLGLEFLSVLFETYRNDIISNLEEIDSEEKIRIIAEFATNSTIDDEIKSSVCDIINSLPNFDDNLVISRTILFLASKSVWFLDHEITLELLNTVASYLESNEHDELMYLLLCDIVSNSLQNHVFHSNEEFLQNLMMMILNLNSHLYGNINSLSTASMCFQYYPAVLENVPNEFVQLMISIITEKLEMNDEILKNYDESFANELSDNSNLIRKVIRMLMPCISNYYSVIDFTPILQCVLNYCSLDYTESFSEFFSVFNFAAENFLDIEPQITNLMEQFVASDDAAYKVLVDFIMNFHLIQINKNHLRFFEIFSSRLNYLSLLVANCKQMFTEYYSPLEYSLQLMFIARLIYLGVLDASDVEYFATQAISAFDNNIGNEKITRLCLFDVVSSSILFGVDVDISSIIGKLCQFCLTHQFKTKYQKFVLMSSLTKYCEIHPCESLNTAIIELHNEETDVDEDLSPEMNRIHDLYNKIILN